MRQHSLAYSLIAIWLVALATGMHVFMSYAAQPGQAAVDAPETWPTTETIIERDTTKPTLVAFIHPHCPCTRASLTELANILKLSNNTIFAHALVVKPDGATAGWEKSATVEQARAIKGLQITVDENATATKQFGAATSGQVLLYDVNGHLQFRGGITPGRGEAGDNDGLRSVLALAKEPSCCGTGDETLESRSETPVYGCALATPGKGTSNAVGTK